MALAPQPLLNTLGPGPRSFLEANPPDTRQWALARAIQEVAYKSPPAARQMLKSLGITMPEAGPPIEPGSVGGATGAEGPEFTAPVTGYDPTLASMGAKFATAFAPLGLLGQVGLNLAGRAAQSEAGRAIAPANLTTPEGTPVVYSGPTTLFGALRGAFGFGPKGEFVDPYGLSLDVPSVSPNMGFGIGFPGSTSLGPTGTGTPRGHTAGVPMSIQPEFDPTQHFQFTGPRPSAPDAPAGGLGFTSDPSEGAGTSEAGLGQAGVGSSATGVGSGTAVGVEGGPVGEAGVGGGGGGGAGTVICTELYRQGLMPQHIWEADVQFGHLIHPRTYLGYLRWAPTVAKWMRRSRLVTALVRPVALAWAREMAHQMGVLREPGSRLGRMVMRLGIPVCTYLGRKATGVYLRP